MCDEHCLRFVALVISPEEVQGKRVLEVGAYDVNGSVRPMLMAYGPQEYVGVDIRNGPGVDMLCDATNLVLQFGQDQFDIVVSTEMLEHVQAWRLAVNNIKRVTRPGGFLVLTTRRIGFPYHEYPGDYWRFEPGDLVAAFADFERVLVQELPSLGVGLRARKPVRGWTVVDLHDIELHAVSTCD